MAKIVKKTGLLRFRDSKSEPRVERPDSRDEVIRSIATVGHTELPPFQRVKRGANECFLANEVLPLCRAVN